MSRQPHRLHAGHPLRRQPRRADLELPRQHPPEQLGSASATAPGADGFRFFVHDAEHTLLNVNENRMGPYPAGDSSVIYSSPQWVWQKLQANAEFRLRVADHVHRHFFNDGALTAGAPRASGSCSGRRDRPRRGGRIRALGRCQTRHAFTRDDWLNAVNNVLNNFLPQRTSVVLNQLRTGGLYPAVAPRPSASTAAACNPASRSRYSAPPATIYYTLDGSDPRLRGGVGLPRRRRLRRPARP